MKDDTITWIFMMSFLALAVIFGILWQQAIIECVVKHGLTEQCNQWKVMKELLHGR